MPKIARSVSGRASGRRTLWVSPELDAADRRLAAARERVDRLSAAIEQDMRLGSSNPEARELLAVCQQILREMHVHRDAVLAEFLKSGPKSHVVETVPSTTPAEGSEFGNSPARIQQ